jgi:NMD protein affecting ribosome stability and mRNA decay
MDEICPRCGDPTDDQWYCSEGYCPTCCIETDEEQEQP